MANKRTKGKNATDTPGKEASEQPGSPASESTHAVCCIDELYVDGATLRVRGTSVFIQQVAGTPTPTLEDYLDHARSQLSTMSEPPPPLELRLCIPIGLTQVASSADTMKTLLLLFTFLTRTAHGVISAGTTTCPP